MYWKKAHGSLLQRSAFFVLSPVFLLQVQQALTEQKISVLPHSKMYRHNSKTPLIRRFSNLPNKNYKKILKPCHTAGFFIIFPATELLLSVPCVALLYFL